MAQAQFSAFGDLLQRYRCAANHSQQALADRAGVSVRTIIDLERGVYHPTSADTIAHVLEALELNAPDRARMHEVTQPLVSASAGASHARSEPMDDTLLMTKLTVPTVRSDLALRPRLTELLQRSLNCKLTVMSAPAGFGKTTLLTQWSAAGMGRSVSLAWVSLDAGDNDPARFWRYTILALQRIHPGTATSALARLQSPQPPPIETVLTVLLNALSAFTAHTLLVFDDYHLMEDGSIHQGVSFLLDHLPPCVHVVMATRDDPPLPLSRLRMRGDLLELRSADLRFTRGETAVLLNEVIGLKLHESDVRTLEARTEGWIAGLQLAALAMRDHDDVGAFISAFAGSNRYVADYLVEEVLLQQTAEMQLFLLQSSILDRMCASVCDALLGWEFGSQAYLEQLERANAFVISLDDERYWYRYHHLFAEVLRLRLRRSQSDLAAQLHRRASAWFERHGLEAEAIRHALAAADWHRAIDLIVEIAPSFGSRGQLQTALAWLDALPVEIVREHPTLCVYQAGALMYTNQVEAAEVRLQDAESSVQKDMWADQAHIVLGQIAAIRAGIARISGDLDLCVVLGRRAVDLLPEPDVVPLKLRAVATLSASRAYQVTGNVTMASERSVTSALAALRAPGNGYASLLSMTNLASFRVMQGRLRLAGAAYEDTMRTVSEAGEMQELFGGPTYYFGMGDILREWNELDAAQGYLKQGMALVKGTVTVDAGTILLGYLSLARLQLALREGEKARETLDELIHLAQKHNFFAPLLARVAAAEARVRLAVGDLPGASRWANTSGLNVCDAPNYPQLDEHLVFARVLVAQGSEDPSGRPVDDALSLLDRLIQAAEEGERIGDVIEMLVLQAVALHVQRKSGASLATLERALILAEPERYVRVFADERVPMASLLAELIRSQHSRWARISMDHSLGAYARHLLAVVRSECESEAPAPVRYDPRAAQPPLDPLTERELEVLQLVVGGLSNREIAAQLFITVGTVKWYVNSVYTKLDVHSRTQAVARAGSLGIFAC